MNYDIVQKNVKQNIVHNFKLHEKFVAASLFQGFTHSVKYLIWTSLSLFSSAREQVVPFVSSIFLRRLFQLEVRQNATLCDTIRDCDGQQNETELKSLSVDELKNEILSLIVTEGSSENVVSILDHWKMVCFHYVDRWRKNNIHLGLLLDKSSGAVGLIRKNSISLFRSLEGSELLIYDSIDKSRHFRSFETKLPENDPDSEIISDKKLLSEVLRCACLINCHLGNTASAILYEAVVSAPSTTFEDILSCLLKILATGYSSVAAAWKIDMDDSKQRKFSVYMLLSFNALCGKAGNWGRVLNVIEEYLKDIVPKFSVQKLDSLSSFDINTSIVVQSTAQFSRKMFESALDILLLLGYLVNISGQVHLMHDDISRIQLKLIPVIHENLLQWHILYFFATTPSKSPSLEDLSVQLSTLYIDKGIVKNSWTGKYESCEFTLCSLIYRNFLKFPEDRFYLPSRSFLHPSDISSLVRIFSSWIEWGSTTEESFNFLGHSTELAIILLRHGQYEAVENLFGIIDVHRHKEITFHGIESTDGEWCKHLQLLGICLLTRAQSLPKGSLKERKVQEAISCFFRALSGFGAPEALQSLHFLGLPTLVQSRGASMAAWKLQYYQWAMQLFEQYNMSDGTCQFAVAALEQVNEVQSSGGDPLLESVITIRGQLWTQVFNLTLDLSNYHDAYCAIISNPDDDSKYICLRRFIIVLCKRGATKEGHLQFLIM